MLVFVDFNILSCLSHLSFICVHTSLEHFISLRFISRVIFCLATTRLCPSCVIPVLVGCINLTSE